LQYLKGKYERSNDESDYEAYAKELTFQQRVDEVFTLFNKAIGITNDISVNEINFSCLKSSVTAYKQICDLRDTFEYELKYVKNIALACEKNVSVEEITNIFTNLCQEN